MLTLQQRILVVAGLGAGFLLAIGLFIYIKNKPAEPVVTKPNNTGGYATPPVEEGKVQYSVVEDEPRVPVAPDDNYIRQTARSFVERFASYSNQNGNAHIDDVLPLASANMTRWLESQRVAASSTYDGVTTIVVTANLTAKTDTKATVRVDTQQIHNGKTSYRAARVEMVREGNDWKVNGLYWE